MTPAHAIEVVKHPPEGLSEVLFQLVDNHCPFPGCQQKPTCVVALRTHRRDVLSVDNSLPLCLAHAERVARGDFDMSLLRTVRQLLRPVRVPANTPGTHTLTSRREYLQAVCDSIGSGTRSLRSVYVGPLPFHPEWYFTLRDGATGLPNMDRAVARCLEDPECATTLILRNDERYVAKMKEVVPFSLWPALAADILARLAVLLAPALRNTVICANTGAFHIPIILDAVAVSAARQGPSSPVEGGALITDPAHVAWERNAFDRMVAYYGLNGTNHAAAVTHFVSTSILKHAS